MELTKLKGYLDQGLSLVKIGKLEGKSLGSIRYWMGVHGLKANFKNFREEPYHKKSVVEGKKCCGRCKEWKEIEAFSTKGEGRHQHYCKVCHAAYTAERWKNRKKKAIELMGGKCGRCGYCRNYSALEFHHIDPSKKEFEFEVGRRCSWDKMIEELKKCILLCSNCHREEHHPDMVLSGEIVETNPSLNWELKATGSCPSCNREVFGTKYCSKPCAIKAKQTTPTGVCPSCGGGVFKTKHCSQACAKRAKRRADRPSKEELAQLIKTKPFVQIGKMYEVSDNAIRKWANHYGLEWRKLN